MFRATRSPVNSAKLENVWEVQCMTGVSGIRSSRGMQIGMARRRQAGIVVSMAGREEQWTEEGGRREGSGEPCSQRLTTSAAPYSLACFYDDTLELTRFFEVQLHKVRTGL